MPLNVPKPTDEKTGAMDKTEESTAQNAASEAGQRLQDAGDSRRADFSLTSEKQQEENDRLYEERMEEEYAKREGGA
jgi:hypothetical protein